MYQSANKNNWLEIITDRLSRKSGASIVEISIKYEDISVEQWRVEDNGNSCSWAEDWLGQNVWGRKREDLIHMARLTVIELAKRSGWLVVKDGVEVITLEDGMREQKK